MKSKISKYIKDKNTKGEKILSVFLTSGFPEKDNFVELALNVLDAGADMLEIGFPFSDPIADGPIIQQSSQTALSNGIDLFKTLNYVKEINKHTDKPIILMGYANPLLSYGLEGFADDSKRIGVDGLIIDQRLNYGGQWQYQKGFSSLTLAEMFYEEPNYQLSAAYYDSAVTFLNDDYPGYNGLPTDWISFWH